jgi:hypothetical protein
MTATRPDPVAPAIDTLAVLVDEAVAWWNDHDDETLEAAFRGTMQAQSYVLVNADMLAEALRSLKAAQRSPSKYPADFEQDAYFILAALEGQS